MICPLKKGKTKGLSTVRFIFVCQLETGLSEIADITVIVCLCEMRDFVFLVSLAGASLPNLFPSRIRERKMLV